MAKEILAGVGAIPGWTQRFIRDAPKAPRPRDVGTLTGMTAKEWNAFVSDIVVATHTIATPIADRITLAEPASIDLDVATRLSRIADADETHPVDMLPEYDQSERILRLTSIEVSGFRGAASKVVLDFTKKGRPVDTLLWGDNGVGKSTLIDGIEFALQGRVDRSADFNSTLRSAVRNLTIPEAHASVSLSDGSISSRSLFQNEAGRDVPTESAVRPGFRIAPVVIRRADILRFLATDALSRGTVFFDYFPSPDSSIGARPDEEIRILNEELYTLRVVRDDLARQLDHQYPGHGFELREKNDLNQFVGSLLLTVDGDEEGRKWDLLPNEARGTISELRTVQTRMGTIKKSVQRGVQTLNPKAYQSQLGRIKPVLREISSDLTRSFADIANAEHVRAIRVLVGKSGPVSLDVVVDFNNGSSALPQQVFSEGYLDLIALLFFLSVTKRAGELGQANVLVLDDALQSVDSSIRLGAMNYILDAFSGWQLIITGHDRGWLAQVKALYGSHGRPYIERIISRWSFEGGIILGSSGWSVSDSMEDALARGDARVTAGTAGLLLEQVCHELSWRLRISVERVQGDRYALGDLWPGIFKVLRKTTLIEHAKKVDLRLSIRNLLGAHYNEWAESISWHDVEQLARGALALYRGTRCLSCHDWVRRGGVALTCPCGTTQVAITR
ncbi:hypothetical protein GCM10009608_33600 [Pseudonocardia alaniniphila]